MKKMYCNKCIIIVTIFLFLFFCSTYEVVAMHNNEKNLSNTPSSSISSFLKSSWEKAKVTCGGVLGSSVGIAALSIGFTLSAVGAASRGLGTSSRVACLSLGLATAGGYVLGILSKKEELQKLEMKRQKEKQKEDQAWIDLQNIKMIQLLDDIEKRKGEDPSRDREQIEKIQLVAEELRDASFFIRESGFDLDIWDENDEDWYIQGGVYEMVPPPGKFWDPYEYPEVFEEESAASQEEHTDGNHTSEVVPQPQPARIASCPAFIPGYNKASHMSSLVGMQQALFSTSEQISTTLKLLGLKAQENVCSSETQLEGSFYSKIQKFQGPVKHVQEQTQIKTSGLSVFNIFANIDSYKTNLEHKIRSGQAGVLIYVISGLSCGLTYDSHKGDTREYKGILLDKGAGAVKTKTDTEALSAVIVANTNKAGFTGQLISSYGWGKVKNIRSFTHANREVNTKGLPSIRFAGGLIQVGYNVLVSKHVVITPYIETMYSLVKWVPYKEVSGPLPCKLSENKEKVIEKSIGLRSHWQATSMSQIQIWIAGVSGHIETNSIKCEPIQKHTSRYKVSVPKNESSYKRTELGISYTANLTNNLELGINSMIRVENFKKFEGQQMALSLRYVY